MWPLVEKVEEGPSGFNLTREALAPRALYLGCSSVPRHDLLV